VPNDYMFKPTIFSKEYYYKNVEEQEEIKENLVK
jgi:hypothetical protein